MKRIILLFGVALLVIAAGVPREVTKTITMLPDSTTATATFGIVSLANHDNNIAGQIIWGASTYTDSATESFGDSAGGYMLLKANYAAGNISHKIDSTDCATWPCTLVVETVNDSLLNANVLEVTVFWQDSTGVDTGQATSDVAINILHTWK